MNITGFNSNATNVLHVTGSGAANTVILNSTPAANVEAATDLLAAAKLASTGAGANALVAFNYHGDTYIEQVAVAGQLETGDTFVHLVGVANAATALSAAHFTVA